MACMNKGGRHDNVKVVKRLKCIWFQVCVLWTGVVHVYKLLGSVDGF